MNRILLDDINNKAINNKEFRVSINDDNNILINKSNYKYVFDVNNSNVNILFNLNANNDLDVSFNINNANVIINIVNFNGVNEVINVNLLGKSTNFELYNSQITYHQINVDINVNHLSSNTKSNIYNCVTTKDEASAYIKVLSKLEKGKKDCILNQDSRIISLNSNSKNKIEPILLIDEYDTEAKHAAFIGKFNEKDLFYLMSRGLSKRKAEKLLLNGFLIGKLKITDEEKEYLKKQI